MVTAHAGQVDSVDTTLRVPVDFESESTSVSDIVPAPSEPERRRMHRRAFLGLAGGVGALGVLGGVLGPRAWDTLFGDSGEAGAMGEAGGANLVVLTLYGGNDGLNTVIPYGDPAYAPARGPLAVAPSSVLPLKDGFGLHAQMPGFKKLWDSKELAIVHGVGFADPNFSHFESMDIWQAGSTDAATSTGWVGRWLDGTRSSPLRAIAVGPTLPPALSGARVQGAAIPVGPLELPGSPARAAALRVRRWRHSGRGRPRSRGRFVGPRPARAAPAARSGARSHRHVEPVASGGRIEPRRRRSGQPGDF